MPKRVGEDIYVPPHTHGTPLLRLAAPQKTVSVGTQMTPLEVEPYALTSKGWSTDAGFSPPTPGTYLYDFACSLQLNGWGTFRTTVSDDEGLDDAIENLVDGVTAGQVIHVRHSGIVTLGRFPARTFIQCDEHACQITVSNFRLDLVRLGGYK